MPLKLVHKVSSRVILALPSSNFASASIVGSLVSSSDHSWYAYLGYPVAPRLARVLAREGDGTDFRPSRNGDETVPVAAHSLRACRRAILRRRRLYAYLGYPVAPRLARVVAREGEGTDFRPSRNGDGAEATGAHSLRAYCGAMVRRRRLYAYLGVSVAPMHVGVGWM